MDFGAFSINGLDSSSGYFLLATILPLIASLIVFVWGYRNYYCSSTDKNNKNKTNQALKGSFGYSVQKTHSTLADKTERSPSTRRHSDNDDLEIFENPENQLSTAMSCSSKKDDKQPLIDNDALRLSDIDVTPLDDESLPKRCPMAEDYNQCRRDDNNSSADDNDDDIDYTNVPGKLKSSKFIKATKELEKSMTDEQKEEEAEIRKQQLESIFKLMKEQEEKFGSQSNEELQEQMRLYAL